MALKLSEKVKEIWDNAEECNCCDTQDCEKNHKLCGECDETVIYGAHESVQPNSNYSWNIDHIKPISKGGTNHSSNLQVVHIECNKNKGSSY